MTTQPLARAFTIGCSPEGRTWTTASLSPAADKERIDVWANPSAYRRLLPSSLASTRERALTQVLHCRPILRSLLGGEICKKIRQVGTRSRTLSRFGAGQPDTLAGRFDESRPSRDNRRVASLQHVGLWRSWERASMAWKRSSVRSRSGPPIKLS
jgi:hypothetical protein